MIIISSSIARHFPQLQPTSEKKCREKVVAAFNACAVLLVHLTCVVSSKDLAVQEIFYFS